MERPCRAGNGPLAFGQRPDPHPRPREVLVHVAVCGICRTDLHLAEGDLAPHKSATVPGHEVVGTVVERGNGAERFSIGERVGIAWLRNTCGVCRFCTRGDENLCLDPMFTAWDADGGFAELAVVDERYAYRIPDVFDDEVAAPLLCAGIMGFRALRRANLPPGGALGVYGFGGSAHIAAQIALHEGATVHVFTRSAEARQLALSLGASSASEPQDDPPEPLDSAILFAPSGDLVPVALSALDRGGALAIAGIHLSDVPTLDYRRHLFQERQVRSVTANTRADGEELLALAAAIPVRPTVVTYPFDHAAHALADLAAGHVNGAAVLRVGA